MTYHDEQRRKLDEAPMQRPMPDSGMSWGLPLGIGATILVVGLILINSMSDRTTTASNNTPAATRSSPAPTPAPAPAAPSTSKQ